MHVLHVSILSLSEQVVQNSNTYGGLGPYLFYICFIFPHTKNTAQFIYRWSLMLGPILKGIELDMTF